MPVILQWYVSSQSIRVVSFFEVFKKYKTARCILCNTCNICAGYMLLETNYYSVHVYLAYLIKILAPSFRICSIKSTFLTIYRNITLFVAFCLSYAYLMNQLIHHKCISKMSCPRKFCCFMSCFVNSYCTSPSYQQNSSFSTICKFWSVLIDITFTLSSVTYISKLLL